MTQLQKRREAAGLLLEDLSRKAGVTIKTLQRLETRAFPDRKVQARVQRGISRALKCKPADLFYGMGTCK